MAPFAPSALRSYSGLNDHFSLLRQEMRRMDRDREKVKEVGVAEAKRRFSELLARAAFAGERFLIERRGKPIAALIGLEDLLYLEALSPRGTEPEAEAEAEEPQGLLAAAGAFADYEDFEAIMEEAVAGRGRSPGRPVSL